MTIDVLKVEYCIIIDGENVNSYANLVIREMECGNWISFPIITETCDYISADSEQLRSRQL